MYIQLTEKRVITAEIPGRTITDLEIESEWNGLQKLVHRASGLYLIVMPNEGMIVDGSAALIDDLLAIPRADGFIAVPAVTLPNGTVVPSFQVGQYHCAKGDNGKAAIDAASKPWVNINYHDARQACEAAGFKLITELQCLAIAHDIVNQDINWTGGKVGDGKVYQGLHKGTVSSAQAGGYESVQSDERRWHQLSNGERIYDFAGNVFTWVFDDVQGDERGIVKGRIAADSPSLTTAPYSSEQKGMGFRPDGERNWSGIALLRGGCWYSDGSAGVFRLSSDWPDRESDGIGFRCTKP